MGDQNQDFIVIHANNIIHLESTARIATLILYFRGSRSSFNDSLLMVHLSTVITVDYLAISGDFYAEVGHISTDIALDDLAIAGSFYAYFVQIDRDRLSWKRILSANFM